MFLKFMFSFSSLYGKNKHLSTEKQHGDANNEPFCFLQSKTTDTLGCLYTMRKIKAVLSLLLIVFMSAKREVGSKSYAVEVQISLQTIYIYMHIYRRNRTFTRFMA
jgi:hypothetical protein